MLSPASLRQFLSSETPSTSSALRNILHRAGTGSPAGESFSSGSSSTSSISNPIDPTIEFGELGELPTPAEITKTLECPVCKEIAFPPIWNCIKGHSICNTCRPQLLNCALCKSALTDGRNYSLESLVMASKFNCHYKDRGCTELIKGENYRDHLRNCKSRPGAGQGCQNIPNTQPAVLAPSPTPSPSTGDSEDPMADLESHFADFDLEDDFEIVSWVKCQNGRYPENAVIAGYGINEPVLIARAYQGNRLIMGRLNPNEKAAFVYWNTCRKKWYYEVLVAIPHTVKWVDASWGDIPVNAIGAGHSPDLENVFIGRACRDGRFIPGYVQPSRNGCFIGVGVQLYLSHDYQVLVRDM